ncbi:FkbM family methyltransferase [uncultured Sulfitobacter sp.]|uniref:FkbM family methyltransferase n=1 Tax=uncultured Sulfitobacter sp. TaxID=191468 RepID=UPI0026167376|nr:FkbM family methyltransferase [uncultured Sulfitobacter sp.]
MDIETRPAIESLYHYSCAFNAINVIKLAWKRDQTPTPGVVTNFIGARIPTQVHPDKLDALAGTVEGPPNPGNWHADIAEWAAALRAVRQAKDTFRIVELGCGWGCWLTNTGVAARDAGLKVDLIGVEGNAHHLDNARTTLALNGFDETDFTLFHGIAGPRTGHAVFPSPDAENTVWNGEAMFYPPPAVLELAKADPDVQVLDCYPLDELAQGKRIDLLHIDIQGAEREYVLGNFPDIKRHVARILIGTHSRAIEGHLTAHFLAAGWRMETDRPVYAPIHGGRPTLAIDGVQMWANPNLTPDLT